MLNESYLHSYIDIVSIFVNVALISNRLYHTKSLILTKAMLSSRLYKTLITELCSSVIVSTFCCIQPGVVRSLILPKCDWQSLVTLYFNIMRSVR
jgi:hypothetical protein